jgi:hypothetical protein
MRRSSQENINRERARLAEMQYNLDILHQQGHEVPQPSPPHNQIQHQPPPPVPSPSQLHNEIHHKPPPPAPPLNHFFQPPLPPQMGTIDPKSSLAEHLQLAPWLLHYRAVPLPKYHGNTDASQVLYVLRSHHSLGSWQRSHPRKIPHHLLGECGCKLVFQTPTVMYPFLATPKRQDSPQLSRIPSRARHRRRFLFQRPKRGNHCRISI